MEVAAGAQDVIEYAKYLGIDPLKEPQLLPIAQEGLCAPLPDGWTEHENDEGNIYYHHQASGDSVWQHPLDNFYRSVCVCARARVAASTACAGTAARLAPGRGGGRRKNKQADRQTSRQRSGEEEREEGRGTAEEARRTHVHGALEPSACCFGANARSSAC